MSDKIIPCLWFNNNAEEAVQLYTSAFDNTATGRIARYDEASAKPAGMPVGSVLTVEFQLEGQSFLGLNGGPAFSFTPAVSLFVACKTKEEVNEKYKILGEGSSVFMPLDKYPFSEWYVWFQDKFGLSWQLMYMGDWEIKQKITPTLMFVGNVCGKAEEAMQLYTSVFKNSSVDNINRYTKEESAVDEGTVKHAEFLLEGQRFAAMDSALEHHFNFNEAISFIVNCRHQEEIDYLSEKLSAVPEAEWCGWIKDKFGISWQIVPEILPELLSNPDNENAGRVMKAMLQMKRMDIEKLKNA